MDEKKYKSVAVIGRIPFDDEDSCYIFHDVTESGAYNMFIAQIYSDAGKEPGEVYTTHTLVSDGDIELT